MLERQPAENTPGSDSAHHECGMHVSNAIHFEQGKTEAKTDTEGKQQQSSDAPSATANNALIPLSTTIHSGSLSSLISFGQVYAVIPPLPFPNKQLCHKLKLVQLEPPTLHHSP